MTVKTRELPVLKEIALDKICANSGQSRGMGVAPQLLKLGHGVFEKVSLDADKQPIWTMLMSEKPEDRKAAVSLIREHEPDIVNAAESLDDWGQLQPIRVVELDDGTYDVVFGMTRCLALAFNHAASSKERDTVDAVVIPKPKDVDLRFMGFAENNDRREESPIDKALFFKEMKKDYELPPEEIGKRVGLTGQSVRDYLKLLHSKLEDKRMEIHEGTLSIDKAKKLLTRRLANEGDEDGAANGKPSGQRARMFGVKKLEVLYTAKKKPEWIEQKEWEMVIREDVRKWLAHRLGKKYKEFSGEVLTVEPEPEKEPEPAPKVLKLSVPKKKAIRLLTALGKPESEGWTDKQLSDKLENIVNIAEVDTKLEDEKLQPFFDKLMTHYSTGIVVTIISK